MYPHERSLVKKLKDRPFALLGIDINDSEKLLKGLRDDGTITWRFWVDKPPGPINTLYRIEAYPTLILIDHKGIIRANDLETHEIDQAVEQLLLEAEKKSS